MTSVVLVVKEPYATEVFRHHRSEIRGMSIVAIESAVVGAVTAIAKHSPHGLVIGPSFLRSVTELVAAVPQGRRPVVVLLVLEANPSLVADALRQGVDHVVAFEHGIEETLVAVASLLNSSDVPDPIPGESSTAPQLFGLIHLRDDVDRRIVELIAEGCGDHEICEAVFLSNQTVRNRISRILFDSDARNRTHLATMYLRNIYAGVSPFVHDSRRRTNPT